MENKIRHGRIFKVRAQALQSEIRKAFDDPSLQLHTMILREEMGIVKPLEEKYKLKLLASIPLLDRGKGKHPIFATDNYFVVSLEKHNGMNVAEKVKEALQKAHIRQ